MIVGVIGLGRMGQAVVARILQAGIDVLGYDPHFPHELDLLVPPPAEKNICMPCSSNTCRAHAQANACSENGTREQPRGSFERVKTLAAIAERATVIWLLVPAGAVVDTVLKELVPFCKTRKPTPVIIDAGNSFFKDSVRRAQSLAQEGISFLDCGTSGGLQGRSIGFCLMLGGEKKAYEEQKQLFRAVAAPQGFAYMGPAGAGHYVKMVHNGIEYGLLQAYGEGFHLLKEGRYPDLDLAAISSLWNQGSVIRSWILELTSTILAQDQELQGTSGALGESGTGKWTVEEAQERGVPVPVIAESLRVRAESRTTGGTYATKLVALLRQAFGGHAVTKAPSLQKNGSLQGGE